MNAFEINSFTSVVVVHASRLVREALTALLEAEGVRVAGAAHLCSEVAQLCAETNASIIVTGTTFNDGTVVDLANSARRLDPSIGLIVVGEGTPEEFKVVLEAGASGYLGSEARGSELAEAVRKVGSGRPALSGINGNGSYQNARNGQRQIEVTPREREIIALLCHGYSNREMAEKLVISEHTVRTHVQNIRTKLNVRSKLEAALFALRAGINISDVDSKHGNGNGRAYTNGNGHSNGNGYTNGHSNGNGHQNGNGNGHQNGNGNGHSRQVAPVFVRGASDANTNGHHDGIKGNDRRQFAAGWDR